MADRVKYFVLGLLLLVVGGVVAFDRWNGEAAPAPETLADGGDRAANGWDIDIGPRKRDAGGDLPQPDKKPAVPEPDSKKTIRIVPPVPQPQPPEPRPQPQPQPPQPKPVVTPPAPKTITHVVRAGESLEVISMRYYKTRKGVDWIADANGIRNKNSIYENQKLVIPARKEGRPQVAGANKPPAQPRTIPTSIRVRAGETDLYKICRRIYGAKGLGARVHRVMELNGLYSADVKPGVLLRLPPK